MASAVNLGEVAISPGSLAMAFAAGITDRTELPTTPELSQTSVGTKRQVAVGFDAVPVLFAGAQGVTPGIDQVSVELPATLWNAP